MSLIFPKKPQVLYAPMLGTLGGGSLRSFGRGTGGGIPDFIWAVRQATGGSHLYQLDPDDLTVTGSYNIHSNYNYSFNSTSGLNNITCDDDGNLYICLGSSGQYSNTRLVKFAPDFSKVWDTTLGGGGNAWGNDYGIPYYRKSDDTLYVYANHDNSINTSSIFRVDPSNGAYNAMTVYSGASDVATAGMNQARNFVVAENENIYSLGGSNTSSNQALWFGSFDPANNHRITEFSAFTLSGGAMGIDYFPTLKEFWVSSQYNSDAVHRFKITFSGNTPSGISNSLRRYANAYMYGGAMSCEAHPSFSSGGGWFFSYYDGNPSYAIYTNSGGQSDELAFNWASVKAASGLSMYNAIDTGTSGGRTYNPNNERFYIATKNPNATNSAGRDIVSWKISGAVTDLTNYSTSNWNTDVISTATNWQQSVSGVADNKVMKIHHSSSRGTQNGL